jgi:hypothetical protein
MPKCQPYAMLRERASPFLALYYILRRFHATCVQNILWLLVFPKSFIWNPTSPKSYARQLHTDSIQVERIDAADKVAFVPFIGIAPNRYRDIFEKGRRKYGEVAQIWNRGQKRPMIEVYYPSYFRAEIHVVKLIQEKLGL